MTFYVGHYDKQFLSHRQLWWVSWTGFRWVSWWSQMFMRQIKLNSLCSSNQLINKGNKFRMIITVELINWVRKRCHSSYNAGCSHRGLYFVLINLTCSHKTWCIFDVQISTTKYRKLILTLSWLMFSIIWHTFLLLWQMALYSWDMKCKIYLFRLLLFCALTPWPNLKLKVKLYFRNDTSLTACFTLVSWECELFSIRLIAETSPQGATCCLTISWHYCSTSSSCHHDLLRSVFVSSTINC